MGDLSKERIAELRAAWARLPDWMTHANIKRSELTALLDMASRSVSVETVRKLSNALIARDERHWSWFDNAAADDLKQAAEALGREG